MVEALVSSAEPLRVQRVRVKDELDAARCARELPVSQCLDGPLVAPPTHVRRHAVTPVSVRFILCAQVEAPQDGIVGCRVKVFARLSWDLSMPMRDGDIG